MRGKCSPDTLVCGVIAYEATHTHVLISSPWSGGSHWLWPSIVSEQSGCAHSEQLSPEEHNHPITQYGSTVYIGIAMGGPAL